MSTMLPLPPLTPPPGEIETRITRLRGQMTKRDIGAVLLTGQNNIEYFSNYRSLSWTSNTRPIFFLVGAASAILIGSQTEERNVTSEPRIFDVLFYRGFLADAIPVVVGALAKLTSERGAKIGIDYGQDMFGRGSIALIDAITEARGGCRVVEAASVIWPVRMVKSAFEADLKRASFEIADRAFDDAIVEARLGITEADLYRKIQSRIILNGAERADPFPVVFGKKPFPYNRWPRDDRRLEDGDYIWTDFRSTYGGYPADRNRIAKAGDIEAREIDTYGKVREITHAICRFIRPGMTGCAIYSHFETLWHEAGLPPIYARAARIGHGGGMDLTEPPSIMATSNEVIEPGFVIHIEPKIEADGAVFQCEEVVHIGPTGNVFLTPFTPYALTQIGI